jgi:hypothetical protein
MAIESVSNAIQRLSIAVESERDRVDNVWIAVESLRNATITFSRVADKHWSAIESAWIAFHKVETCDREPLNCESERKACGLERTDRDSYGMERADELTKVDPRGKGRGLELQGRDRERQERAPQLLDGDS